MTIQTEIPDFPDYETPAHDQARDSKIRHRKADGIYNREVRRD